MTDFARLYKTLYDEASVSRERHAQVTEVRRGNVPPEVADMFPDNWPATVTADVIDTAARDMGEMLGELPSMRVRPASSSAVDARRAAKRTKIVLGYLEHSSLQLQMYAACDRLVTYSGLPFVVDPDYEARMPRVRVASVTKSLWRKNLRGDVVDFFEYWTEPRHQLQAKFPEARLKTQYEIDTGWAPDDKEMTVVRYYGKDRIVLFCPTADDEVLASAKNPVGRVPVRVVELPKWDDEQTHGTYDKALWIQLAKARVQLMAMEAMDKSIHAPLAVTPDVTTIPYGPDAIIQSQQPEKIRRVELPVSRDTWLESSTLERELRVGSRYPEGRSGNIDASVITGQGVDALLGTMDSQLKTLQTLIAFELKHLVGLMLRMDEALWGDVKKTIAGSINGKDFEEDYTPSVDINGSYAVDVSYGLMAGMDPNRATVMMLQLLGAGIIDKRTVREQMPFGLDVDSIEERLHREQLDSAVLSGVQSMLGNLAAAEQMGENPVDLLVKAATLVKEREKGKPLIDAVLETFKKVEKEQAPQDPFEAAQQQLADAPAGGPPPPPGGGGGLMQMLAQISGSGKPTMAARRLSQMPVQG